MNHNHTEQNTITQNVLEQIAAGHVSMRSRGRFLIQLGLMVLLAIVVITLSAAIFSFILFSIRQSGSGALFGSGLNWDSREFLLFVQLFPWMFLAIDVAAIIVLELLLRQFAFGYRRSLFSLLLIALALTAVLGVALDQSRANDSLLEGARNHSVPFFGTVYDAERRPPPRELGICRCVIEGVSGDVLIMREDSPFGSTTVMGILPPGFATSSLLIGQPLFIIGDFASDTIRVVDVRVLQRN